MIESIAIILIGAPIWGTFFYTVFLFVQFLWNVVRSDETDDWSSHR